MDHVFQPVPPIKSALFVDFDNIYIGLTKSDPLAAERFASDPSRWLAWLEKGCLDRSADQYRPRSILIRRCYPNPDAGFRHYRSFFTSAAFSVIDCPSQTRTGKNSADIYMVMDILDMLNHKTYFDEFIIFSGDSDFMPVLLRLRAHDRRTTTLAVDFMTPAYKAACDFVISEEEFIEEALGLSVEENSASGAAARARVPVAVLKAMAARVFATVREDGEVAGADLPDILKDFHEFRDSTNWLGFGTSQRLAEALVSSEPRLSLVRLNPMMYKLVQKVAVLPSAPISLETLPAVIAPPVLQPPVLPSPVIKPAPLTRRSGRFARKLEQPAAAPTPVESADKPEKIDLAGLRGQVVALVQELVRGSDTPVLLARASQHVVSRLGPQVLATQWAGAGTFKKLLQTVGDLGLEITTHPEPGYLFDPRRHEKPSMRRPEPAAEAATSLGEEDETTGEAVSTPILVESNAYSLEPQNGSYEDDEDEEEEAGEEEYEESLPSLEEFVRRVGQVTGAPDLTPQQYALAFHGIVAELQQIAAEEKAYNTYQSSKAISDWCAERGETISRGDLVLILKGIIFQEGVRFSKRPGSYTAKELAVIVRKNIKALCRRSRLEISEYEEHLLDEWMLGGLEEEENAAAFQAESGAEQPAQENINPPEG
jgi:uncharacterized LabA/DUF88 family protein